MVPGGAGCLSQEVEVEEEEEVEAEGVVEIEKVVFCSPPRVWIYGTPAADTTTVALWVDDGTDSWPNSVRGEERRGGEEKKAKEREGHYKENKGMERIKRKKGKLRKGKHRTDNIGMRRKERKR